MANDPRTHIDKFKNPLIETLQLAAPSVFMRSGPRPSASAETQLIFGTLFHVHKIGRGWVWGQAETPLPGRTFPGYVGWVKTADFTSLDQIANFKVTTLSAPVFKSPNIKSPVVQILPLNACLAAQKSGGFYASNMGFIHSAHMSKIDAASIHMDWVAVAESLMGQPYIWGGVSSGGLDCSGLVQTALRAFGQDAPRDSDQQAKLGQAVPIKDDLSGLMRGDLVFWKGHVGIMLSPQRLLHANAHHMLVAAEPLKTAAARIEKNAGPITAIRRV